MHTSTMKILTYIILLPLLLFVLAFVSLFIYVCYQEKHVPPTDNADAIIVLGAQVKTDGTPSVQLLLRLQTALSVYQQNPMTIISCGGQGKDEPIEEGKMMTEWLLQNGVKKEHALMEITSTSTEENLKNAIDLLDKDAKKVLVVTSDYHLPRAISMAHDLGLDASGHGAPTTKEFFFKNRSREALAWGKYLLNKILPF